MRNISSVPGDVVVLAAELRPAPVISTPRPMPPSSLGMGGAGASLLRPFPHPIFSAAQPCRYAVATEAVAGRHPDDPAYARIVIARRPGTIRDADLILVLDDGTITERGVPNDLLTLGGRDASHFGDRIATRKAT